MIFYYKKIEHEINFQILENYFFDIRKYFLIL